MAQFLVNSLATAKNYFLCKLLEQYNSIGNAHLYVQYIGDIKDQATKWTPEKRMIKLENETMSVCHAYRKQIIGPLGIDEWVHYYVNYIYKWNKYWCTEDTFNISRYNKTEGMLFSPKIFDHIYRSGNPRSVIVAVLPDLSIRYLKVEDYVQEMTNDKNVGTYSFYRDSLGISRCGAPKEIFTNEDPYSKIK